MVVIRIFAFVLSTLYRAWVYCELGYQQIVRDVASPLCPYTDFCHTSAPKQIQFKQENVTSCCTECSCAEDCWKIKNCCPDGGISESKPSEFVCKETLVKQRKNKMAYSVDAVIGRMNKIDGINGGIKMYFIVASCHENQRNSSLHNKCSGENKTTLDDYLWVSDLQTGIIYQNKHCALCNGAESWVRWKIRTDCEAILHTEYSGIADRILSDICSIISEVPDTQVAAAKKYKCYIPAYSACNQTGSWKIYDRDIDEACQLFSHTAFYPPLVGSLEIYKNPFCFVCNSESELPEHCPNPENGIRSTQQMPFSTLIDFGIAKTHQQVISDCGLDELDDPYLKSCRKLTCPLGTVAFYGQCKQLTVNPTGLSVRISLFLKILWDTTQNSFNLDGVDSGELGFLVHQKLKNALAIEGCSDCHSGVYLSNRSTFIFTSLFDVDLSCTFDIINTKVAKVLGSQMVIGLDMINISMAVDLERRSYKIIKEETLALYLGYAPFPCHQGENVIKIVCPTVQLNITESSTLTDKALRDNYLLFFDGIEEINQSTIVHVCTKDYFSIMAQSSTSLSQVEKISWIFFYIFYSFVHGFCIHN